MTVAQRIYAIILIACAGFGVSALFSYNSLNDLEKLWSGYQRDASSRQTLISELRSEMGYGGYIHNFKNYVLRGTPKYADKVKSSAEVIRGQLQNFSDLPEITAEEKTAVDKIGGVVDAYAAALERAAELFAKGETASSVDKVIKISDKPALEGLNTLQEVFIHQKAEHTVEFNDRVASAMTTLWVSLGITVVLLIGVGLRVAGSIIKPLGGEPAQMEALALKVAEGNLNIWSDTNAQGLYASLINMASKIKEVMSVIAVNSSTLASTTAGLSENGAEIQQTAKAVNEGIESNSAALMQSSANTNALSESIQELAESSQEIFQLASTAKNEAQAGQQAMEDTNVAINKISESSSKINGIIDVITEISNQTNLLSLNAAIEAAKAGEFGKGFAVVADEVRMLADRSSSAVEQIRQLIEVSSKNVTEGKDVVARTGKVLDRIIAQVTTIAENGNKMALDMEEKKAGAMELDQAINEITETSETNAEAMTKLFVELSQIESTLGDFSQMAQTLQSEVSYFKFDDK